MKPYQFFLAYLILFMAAVTSGQAKDAHEGLTIGFSQVGAESDWRIAFTEAILAEAEARGIDLLFSDAENNQENQMAAIRSFITQEVDAIILAPVIETGWEQVLR